uniref:Low-density lipoprotein receptor domain class A n=1 Tax=Panagrellus redivivus TaxID=6233 RepID=A0A7E4ZYG8_PANRE
MPMLNLQCDGFDHCGDASDEFCYIGSTAYGTPHIDFAGALTLVIGSVLFIVLLLTIVAVMSKFYRNRFLNQTRGRSGHARSTSIINSAGNAMAMEAYCNELAPTTQTIGDIRFYVLPESQISVIEAPPTYDDALKHPAIPVLPLRQRARSAMAFVYVNDGYTPEGGPSNLASPERQAPTATPEPTEGPIPRPRRVKRRLTKTGTDAAATSSAQRTQSSSTSPRLEPESTDPPTASPPPPPTSSPPEADCKGEARKSA